MGSSAEKTDDRSTGEQPEAKGASSLAPSSPATPDDSGLQALRVIRHDFKTPLTSLKMLGQIFQLGLERGTLAQQPERTERNCRMLVEQVDKLVHLADVLYEISILQADRLTLERQLADLRPVLQSLLPRFADQIESLDLPEQPVWGRWDTGKLMSAFAHLLVEANSVRIEMRDDASAGKARIRISGEFKPASDKTSPGRFIARRLIEKHGGTLSGRFNAELPTVPPAPRQ